VTTTLTLDDDLAPLVDAFRRGRPTVLPTDTVYGLATAAHLPDACERLLRLKGRDLAQPTAVLCGSVETLFTTVLPELFGRAGVRARRLLPGPVTLVVPNPSRRFRWLCGPTPDRLGVRVPDLDPRLAAAIDRVGAVAATSANPTGGEAPVRLSDVDPALLARVDVALDGGELAGTASTFVDLTGREPVVLRAGPLSEEEVRRRLEAG
jgi:L-threonylcarbamoyladenylate synthase